VNPMRIMIVDDNALMRKEIINTVVEKNDVVMECADGESAVTNSTQFCPDWILMDIRMGKLNGLSAASEIKKLLPQIHVAILTSYDNFQYRQKAEACGVEFYFLKNNMLEIRKLLNERALYD